MNSRVANILIGSAAAVTIALGGLSACSNGAKPGEAPKGGTAPAAVEKGAEKAGEPKTAESPVTPTPDQPAPAEAAAAGLANLPRKGPADAKVVIVESSEFQCPFCSRVTGTMKQIAEAYPNDVAIYFFHNPLSFHPNAMPAAKASMAAHKQGKFWEMHDKLFENQRELTPENFDKWAGELGLDLERFKRDMADPTVEAEIKRQQAAMVALGARGTPGFFINGEQLKGAQPFEAFKTVIDKHLALADAEIAKGAKKSDAWVTVAKATHPAGEDFGKWVAGGEAPPANAAATDKPAEAPQRPVADQTVWKVTVDENDAKQGGKEPLVTLVQFSEFQCPFCSRITPTVKQIHETYGEDVAVVFKHAPLPFHKDAVPASLAAIAAQKQGKFWEMHDKLFANQRELSAESLEKYATELGLDMTRWKADMADEANKKIIEQDQKLAAEVNARGTPNTFVNGRQVTGAQPFEAFKTIIDEELAKAKKLVDAGTPRAQVYAETIKNGKVFKALDDAVQSFTLEGRPVKGNPKAKIVITEFSDFQCPFCSRVYPALEEAKKEYGDDLAIVFKQFPLSFHQQATPAAKAALAAGEQGKYWEMHDKLFANQKDFTPEKFEEWAKELGLDTEKFKASMADTKWDELIKADMEEGTKAGVRGTPTVFINGRKFQPTTGYNGQAFKQVIDSEILGK